MNKDSKPFKIGNRLVPVWVIPVQILDNDEDYEFVFTDHGDGKKVMSVF